MTGKNVLDDLKKAMKIIETMKTQDVVLLHPVLYETLKQMEELDGVVLIPCHFVEPEKAYVVTDEQLKKDILNMYRSRRKEI